MNAHNASTQFVVDAPAPRGHQLFYTAIGTAVLSAWIWSVFFTKVSRFPSVNYKSSEWTYFSAKRKFTSNAKELITQGFQKFGGPFSMITDFGPLIVLPPDMIDAVNQEESLSFKAFTKQQHLTQYDTFKVFRSPPPGLFEDAVLKGLTRNLPKFTKPLSDEMASCLNDTWGDNAEWHEVEMRKDILDWVARLSTRIFLGERLVTNKDWLRISVNFTVDSFTGLAICRLVPAPLRWLAVALLPITRRLRNQYRMCESIIDPIIAELHTEIATAQHEGRAPELPDDSIEWFRAASRGRPYHETYIQLGLAIAAIHTTSDLLAQALLNLCAYPEYTKPLREEAISVLKKFGWKKVALTELRLLDSFFKETQRMKPILMVNMHRCATEDVELSGGLKIRKGERTAISSHRMWSPDDYENPDKFDGFRFFERRKIPGYENRSLLVATSQDHTAFSHGKHACPGRFFAANEVKIAMVHLLLKYDFQTEDKTQAKWMEYGTSMFANPKAKISVKRRQAEVDIDLIPADI